MNLQDYQEDENRQNNGVRVKIDDAVFTIKRFGTKESDVFMANLRKKKYNPYAVISDGEKQHLENEVFGEWLAKYAVTDWDGVYMDGEIDVVTDSVDSFNDLPDVRLCVGQFWDVKESQGWWRLWTRKLKGLYKSDGAKWSHIRNPKFAEEVKYSKAMAYEIFTNPEYFLSLNNALISRAVDVKNFLHIMADEHIDAIKPKIKFDTDHPTAQEKQMYLKHCDALGADAGLPELNELQNELLSAFYRADRNRDKDCVLKDKQIIEQVRGVALDQDIAVSIIQHLDSYLLECRNEKMKRESKK